MERIPEIEFSNGESIPALGLGTWRLNGKECIEAVKIAVSELGYTHIDTAEAYGNHGEIAKAIKGFSREGLFITSKLWLTDLRYNDALKACDKALKELDTNYLDLYLIHWPKKEVPFKETFKALKEVVGEGKARSIGISNFTVKHLEKALPIAEEIGIKFVTNQVEFHPLFYQKELREYCESHNLVTTAYSPIARGAFMEEETLKSIGEKFGKTAAQVSLRWLFQKGIVIIPKAAKREHLEQNRAIFDFKLSEEDMNAIDSIETRKRFVAPDFNEFDE